MKQGALLHPYKLGTQCDYKLKKQQQLPAAKKKKVLVDFGTIDSIPKIPSFFLPQLI